MTKEEAVYADTLNLLGTGPGVETQEIQEMLDKEHRLADPVWWSNKEESRRSLECTA